MDKEEYLNKEEYQNLEGMNSYEEHPPEDDNQQDNNDQLESHRYIEDENQLEAEGEYDQSEIRHAGLQTNFLEEESKHVLVYVLEGFEPEHAVVDVDEASIQDNYQDYENSPIQENEEEQYSTPNAYQYNQDQQMDDRMQLFRIANEVKKKDQSKKFVLWEKTQMRNEWDEKSYPINRRVISQKKLEHHWNNDIERARNDPTSKARAFDYNNIEEQNLPIHKSKKWNDNVESRIPLLSDHELAKQRNRSKRIEIGTGLENIQKKNHVLNNIFQQSLLQQQLSNTKSQQNLKAPLSHQSLQSKFKIFQNKFRKRAVCRKTIIWNGDKWRKSYPKCECRQEQDFLLVPYLLNNLTIWVQ